MPGSQFRTIFVVRPENVRSSGGMIMRQIKDLDVRQTLEASIQLVPQEHDIVNDILIGPLPCRQILSER